MASVLKLSKTSTRVLGSMMGRNNYFTYSNQISQPMERDPQWVSAQEAVKCIKSGNFRQVSRKFCNRLRHTSENSSACRGRKNKRGVFMSDVTFLINQWKLRFWFEFSSKVVVLFKFPNSTVFPDFQMNF